MSENFLVTHTFKCLAIQNNLYWQNQLNFVKKILKYYKMHFAHTLIKKIIKHLAEKSFSVPNGVWRRPNEHTKTFFGQMFNFYLSKYTKNVFFFYNFKFFVNKILLILSIKLILYSKAFKYLHYKKNLSWWNPNTRISDMTKLRKAIKIYKCPPFV